MRVVLLFSLFLTSLYSTTITNHNIYKQQDSIDLMLTFDEPYLGKISKKVENKSTILMLENINLAESITKEVDSEIIQKFQLLPYKNQIFIKVDAQNPYTIEASKTVDNFGLRIRIKPQILQTLKTLQPPKQFETKKEQDISGSFIKVIAILSFLVLLLYILKRWLENNSPQTSSWLFSKDNSKKQPIKVINQKAIDTKNRVALIEYDDMSYLVILGNNPILLDKFKTSGKDKKEQFDTLLSENTNKLDTVLNSN